MYIAIAGCFDCPSERDGRALAKGKTLEIMVQNLVNYCETTLDGASRDNKYEYDNKYFYINGQEKFIIQKV